MKRQFGTPVTFGECAGFFHDGGGSTGVLMLPAWGFEEMTIRRGWAGFADRIAACGYPVLRFDWPGCGDSLGDTANGIQLSQWRQAVSGAATYLRSQAHVERIVLIGHGLGGLMALHVAADISPCAIVSMAPQGEGNAGLRELEIWGRMIGSFLRLPAASSKDVLEVAGHGMSRAFAAEIAGLRLPDASPFASPVPLLLVQRSGTTVSPVFGEALAEGGFAVTAIAYTGWDAFLSQTSASVPPLADFQAVIDWLLAQVPPGKRSAGLLAAPVPGSLEGDGFSERPMLFGAERGLFGILCEPRGQKSRATIIMINSGDNYHIGWARMHVQFARQLARVGISSFRIDTGGIGEADDVNGHLFYVPRQLEDVTAAVDTASKEAPGPVVLLGRCSGGYAAVQVAAADERIAGIVAVNTVRLSIGEDESFEDVMSTGTSSMADYGKRALSPRLFIDILTGKMPLSTVMSKGRHILKTQFSLRFPALHARFSGAGRLTRLTRAQAETLNQRNVSVHLLYADNDAGLDELARHFGRREPDQYDHATVRIVQGAEHNMTAPFAREAILQSAIEAVERVSGRAS